MVFQHGWARKENYKINKILDKVVHFPINADDI
jgi:hypothetical protein